MKDHAKVGNRPGNPTFRTPSQFKNREDLSLERKKGKSKINKSKPYK